MTEAIELGFIGDAPANYDKYLGPHLFEDYAADLARRAAVERPQHVLELACGTGISGRALRNALAAETELVLTDFSADMLEIAKSKFATEEKASFQTADAMDPPFEAERFDMIVCQFGVMFLPDRSTAYRAIREVLQPGGLFLFNAWGDLAANPFAALTAAFSDELFPDDPPAFMRMPFSYSDPELAQRELLDAGFHEVGGETVRFARKVENWAHLARGLILGNPLGAEIAARGGPAPDAVIESLAARFETAMGPAPSCMPLEAHVAWGRKPGEN